MELTAYVVLKFHEWAYSDLMDNTVRGDFAEYLVARALGLTSSCRKNWGPFDLKTAYWRGKTTAGVGVEWGFQGDDGFAGGVRARASSAGRGGVGDEEVGGEGGAA